MDYKYRATPQHKIERNYSGATKKSNWDPCCLHLYSCRYVFIEHNVARSQKPDCLSDRYNYNTKHGSDNVFPTPHDIIYEYKTGYMGWKHFNFLPKYLKRSQ